jgi:catechol 2,3-dioxygenase-like lactoylglutathione lyase family enzyme
MERIIAKLVRDFELGKLSRRQLIQTLTLTAATASAVGAAPADEPDSKLIKAISVNHIVYNVPDYAKARDLYAGLLGLQATNDDGKSCRLKIGDTTLVIRNVGTYQSPTGNFTAGSDKTGIDHIAYTIANWDTDPKVKEAMRAELTRHGLPAIENSMNGFTQAPDGFGLKVETGGKDQFSRKAKA